jgi:hypothetical protein
MKNTRLIFILICVIGKLSLTAQTWALHLNGNETYTLGNDLKGNHPVLWNSQAQDKVVFGGFGLGVSNTRAIKENTLLRFQANLQRSRFYDVPSIIRDENGLPLLASIGINSNYNLGLLSMAFWQFGKHRRLEAGAGLGGRAVFFAKTDFGKAYVNGEKASLNLRNKAMSPAVLLLPISFGYRVGRFSFANRAEIALSRVNRIAAWKKERSIILFVEVAYHLGIN